MHSLTRRFAHKVINIQAQLFFRPTPLILVPMFRDALVKMDVLEVEEVLPQVNPLLDGSDFNARTATVLGMDLPFYPGHRFLEIADHSLSPPRRVFAIIRPGQKAVILDWTNGPIYRINAEAPIRLNEKTVLDYARFFFTFVRGRHGRFFITENVEDIAWKDEPPATARKTLGSLIEPMRLTGIDNDGTYNLLARLIFKDSLFKGVIKISPNGMVNLDEEELVVEDLPVVDDILG